jgi:hypothetical protein
MFVAVRRTFEPSIPSGGLDLLPGLHDARVGFR